MSVESTSSFTWIPKSGGDSSISSSGISSSGSSISSSLMGTFYLALIMSIKSYDFSNLILSGAIGLNRTRPDAFLW